MMASERDRAPIREEYRRPGSRFDRMMTAIERGACLEEMMDLFDGMDESAYDVLRMIHKGTISQGDYYFHARLNPDKAIERALQKKEQNAKIFRMFDDGAKTKDVQRMMGLSRGAAEHARKKWAIARGLASRKKRGA